MKVSHNQPHLVPPMKLVFYDEMPNSPGLRPSSARRMSHWVSQGRELASKASDRASLTIKRKLSKQTIRTPLTILKVDDPPLRRHNFRPLELSIYLPGNRLSDLPGFENINFTDEGEIQVPPKALIRSRSEDILQSFPKITDRPIPSMVGERQLDYWQPRPSSAVSQRPPSSCEALNSHPVRWTSFPGLPPQTEATIKPLSPMAEVEETSPIIPNAVDNVVLEFPPVQEEEQLHRPTEPVVTSTIQNPLTIQVPYKQPHRPNPARLNSFTTTRISQWLSRSSLSTTTRTAASLDTPRPQFYQCALSPPPNQNQNSFSHSRSRSFSVSTLASSIGSPTESLASMTSMTTAPTVQSPRSRSGTLRSLGKRVLVVEEEEEVETLPGIPALYAQVQGQEGAGLGKMQTGGVADSVGPGTAF
jgi:hypothetical protein